MGGETMAGGKTPVQKFEDTLKNILVGQATRNPDIVFHQRKAASWAEFTA